MRSILHASDLQELQRRLASLTPHADRRWGRMTAHQAVCHLSDWFRAILGDRPIPAKEPSAGLKVLRFIAFTTPLPWLRGFPTSPMTDQEKLGTPPAEFAADVAALQALMLRFVATRGEGLPPHNRWGRMSAAMWGRYGYRHVNHHLRQFGR